ncbi:54K polar flagellar sheath protein A [Vibrio astriarenae]
MKKAVVLPIVAAVSGALLGCGGGGGGGGTPAPSKTKFEFSFAIPYTYTLEEANKAGCTIYAREGYENEDNVLTYSSATADQVRNFVIGYYSNEDGVQEGELIVPSSDKFNFNLEDIPENGFITFQMMEFNGREFRATSFSREFLEDKAIQKVTFGLNRDSLNKCITGGNYITKEFKNLSYLNEVSGGRDYYFQSQSEVQAFANPQLLDGEVINGFDGEPTIVTQYLDEEKTVLHQYGIASWSGSPIVLSSTGQESDVLNPMNYPYETLEISVISSGYQYDLLELPNSQNYFNHPTDTQGETWLYLAEPSTPISGWNTLYSSPISDSWELNVDPDSLLALSGLVDDKPIVYTTAGVDEVNTGAGLSNENGAMRLAYRSSYDNYVSTHKVYAKPTDYLVVPQLHYYQFGNTVADGLRVSEQSTFNRTILVEGNGGEEVNSKTFMTLFAHGDADQPELDADLDGIVVSELNIDSALIDLRQSEVFLVDRTN